MSTLADVASLATAGGTLILAVATFSAVRSGNRTARAAERSLLAGIRPVLAPSKPDDAELKINWADEHWSRVRGGQAGVELEGDVIYLAMPVRNVGAGMAVLHGWCVHPDWDAQRPHAEPDGFRRQARDIYVPAGDVAMWQGALRDRGEELWDQVAEAIRDRRRFTIDLLYGDHEGGQRTITRFGITPVGEDAWLTTVARYWNLDRPDPR